MLSSFPSINLGFIPTKITATKMIIITNGENREMMLGSPTVLHPSGLRLQNYVFGNISNADFDCSELVCFARFTVLCTGTLILRFFPFTSSKTFQLTLGLVREKEVSALKCSGSEVQHVQHWTRLTTKHCN